MPNQVEIKPDPLSGSISRIAEAFSDRGYNTNNRGLPHPYLSLGIGLGFGAVAFLVLTFLMHSSASSLSMAALIGFSASIPVILLFTFLGQVYFLGKELENRKYIISPEGVEIVDDYLDKNQTKISFSRVTDVEMEQPLTQRFFGTGNVKLNTAGSDNQEAKIEFIKNTELVNEEISGMIAGASNNNDRTQRAQEDVNPVRMQKEEERTLKPNLKAGMISNFALALVGAPLMFGLSLAITYFRDFPEGLAMPFSIAVAGAVFVYMTVGKYFNLKATEYRFGDGKVEVYEGFLNVQSHTIPYNSITDISMSKPIIQRLVGTGSIHLNTAGNNLYEGSIAFIDNPDEELEKIKKIAHIN